MSIRFMLSRRRADTLEAAAPRECAHWELAPRWDCNEDIGKDEKVTFYKCATCGESFSREEGAGLRREY